MTDHLAKVKYSGRKAHALWGGRHHVTVRWSGVCGLVDSESSRATCSCGWQTGWDSGWHFVTRLRVWWHVRGTYPGEYRDFDPERWGNSTEQRREVVAEARLNRREDPVSGAFNVLRA